MRFGYALLRDGLLFGWMNDGRINRRGGLLYGDDVPGRGCDNGVPKPTSNYLSRRDMAIWRYGVKSKRGRGM